MQRWLCVLACVTSLAACNRSATSASSPTATPATSAAASTTSSPLAAASPSPTGPVCCCSTVTAGVQHAPTVREACEQHLEGTFVTVMRGRCVDDSLCGDSLTAEQCCCEKTVPTKGFVVLAQPMCTARDGQCVDDSACAGGE